MGDNSVFSGVQGPQGAQGPVGPQGPTGPTGAGVPAGGTALQHLRKIDATDFNTEWADPPSSIFGSEFQNVESTGISTTTSSTFQQKLRLTTTSLPLGNYILHWSSEIGNQTSDRESEAQLEMDDTTVLGTANAKVKAGAGWEISFSGHAVMNAISGVHTFDLDFRAVTGTAFMEHAHLTLWRVS